LEAVLEVYRECEDFLALGPVAQASREMVLKDMDLWRAEGGVYCGVFNAPGEMIGVLDCIPGGYRGDAQTAYLELPMLATPHRGGGLGAAIVEALEGELRQRGVRTILAGVQVINPRALKFWRRHGFQVISGPILHFDGTTAYDLSKELDP